LAGFWATRRQTEVKAPSAMARVRFFMMGKASGV
jgi:hypothetical protein